MIETTSLISDSESTVTTVADSINDLSRLSEIDVDLLNSFLYLGSSFIIGVFFFFVCKGLYRLICMFF